jgi:nitrite reductase/ring-hydroxylating ferredoxin subunit
MSDEERLEQALEAIRRDQSPRALTPGLDLEQQQMLHVAQLLRGSRTPSVSPEFVEQLRGRLIPQSKRISRRTAFLATLGTMAAGLAAGIGLDRATNGIASVPVLGALVPYQGRWYRIASMVDLTEGVVLPFTAGAVQGFVMQRHGQVRAISRICTHMGCALNYERSQAVLECPCHGAAFNLAGQLQSGPESYRTGSVIIPPLPEIRSRVRGDSVEVFGT